VKEFEKLNLNIQTNNIISLHIIRLLETKKLLEINFDENAIAEFLFELVEIIEKYFNYCSCCGCELKTKGIEKISCCKNSDCVIMSYQMVLDNCVIEFYKQDPIVFFFLLNILINGSSHPKGELAFKPLPLIKNVNNLIKFKKILGDEKKLLTEEKLKYVLDESETDLELIKKTNPTVYSIFKNAISNNYFSMSSRDNINISKKYSKNATYTTTKSLRFIHINYSSDIENKFTQKYFLFHGSSISSWYPIVKNGLKVMSGTEMMTHGAAFGNGIYFSDSFQMSFSYSGGGVKITNGSNNDCVVGVFEILENPDKYKKSRSIFVINDDTIILLRTLVLIKSGSSIPKDISNYFLKELPEQKQANKLNVGILKNKRLLGEHKKLLELDFIKEINIINRCKWNISLTPIKYEIIIVEIEFSNYPINPPILKLNNNIKIDGLVEDSKKISIDLINPANWKITNNLSQIITILYKCFQESL
jgi:ubiquitin-protein ligase